MTASSVQASAPGKAILAGEYAVLDGAPAICMAVNRRASVSIEKTTADWHSVIAPGYSDETTRFRVRDRNIEWLDDGRPYALLEHIVRATGLGGTESLALMLDTSAFFDADTGRKIGIGSSAALTVALTHAVSELQASKRNPIDTAHQCHRSFQGGRGSGADIATSAAGGLVQFETADRRIARVEQPAGIEFRLLWSGTPVSTDKKLEGLSRGSQRPSRLALADVSAQIAKSWRNESAASLLRLFREYVQVLRAFSIDHELGIFNAGHGELAAAAAAAGLIYKPCGAGGGDIGVLLADDAGAIDRFVANELPKSFQVTDMTIDPRGVAVTRKPH